MRLHLVDTNASLVAAWSTAFADQPEVSIQNADILDVAQDAVVSPANSHGFMDGGVDADYARFFGPDLERRVRDVITARPEGFLPVGAAVIVPTAHARIRFLVLAPTMEMPETVPASHAYRALRAALRVTAGRDILDLYCPGLATHVGGVDVEDAAREMATAYSDWLRTGS